MRIRIIRAAHGNVQGFDLQMFEPGSLYDVSRELGRFLLEVGSAEFVRSEEPALLIPCSPMRPTGPRPRTAAKTPPFDRGSGSMFAYEPSERVDASD